MVSAITCPDAEYLIRRAGVRLPVGACTSASGTAPAAFFDNRSRGGRGLPIVASATAASRIVHPVISTTGSIPTAQGGGRHACANVFSRRVLATDTSMTVCVMH